MPALWFAFLFLFLLSVLLTDVWLTFYFLVADVSRLTNPIAKWDIKGTQTALLQPFSPIVIAADENERIRYVKLIHNFIT